MGNDQGGMHYTERMVPGEAHARVFWEHVERYRFAKNFVQGKRVLDIACGEGYGARRACQGRRGKCDRD